jgi:hypothetical protein
VNPIGKGYGGFDIYPHAVKRYKCERCGYITTQTTNHFQPTWSHDHVHVCPQCPPWAKYPEFGGQTVWICIDTPESMNAEKDQQSRTESVLREADELLPAPAGAPGPQANPFSEEAFDALEDGVRPGTESGKDWSNLLYGIRRLATTVVDFKDQFTDPAHGPLPNLTGAQRQLVEMLRVCQQLKPVIIGMSEIERRDMLG